jgi:hypothetical protein
MTLEGTTEGERRVMKYKVWGLVAFCSLGVMTALYSNCGNLKVQLASEPVSSNTPGVDSPTPNHLYSNQIRDLQLQPLPVTRPIYSIRLNTPEVIFRSINGGQSFTAVPGLTRAPDPTARCSFAQMPHALFGNCEASNPGVQTTNVGFWQLPDAGPLQFLRTFVRSNGTYNFMATDFLENMIVANSTFVSTETLPLPNGTNYQYRKNSMGVYNIQAASPPEYSVSVLDSFAPAEYHSIKGTAATRSSMNAYYSAGIAYNYSALPDSTVQRRATLVVRRASISTWATIATYDLGLMTTESFPVLVSDSRGDVVLFFVYAGPGPTPGTNVYRQIFKRFKADESAPIDVDTEITRVGSNVSLAKFDNENNLIMVGPSPDLTTTIVNVYYADGRPKLTVSYRKSDSSTTLPVFLQLASDGSIVVSGYALRTVNGIQSQEDFIVALTRNTSP